MEISSRRFCNSANFFCRNFIRKISLNRWRNISAISECRSDSWMLSWVFRLEIRRKEPFSCTAVIMSLALNRSGNSDRESNWIWSKCYWSACHCFRPPKSIPCTSSNCFLRDASKLFSTCIAVFCFYEVFLTIKLFQFSVKNTNDLDQEIFPDFPSGRAGPAVLRQNQTVEGLAVRRARV